METATYTVERYQTERDWLKARLLGVGASESSAVVGLSDFCHQYGLYVRKREGRVEDDGGNLGEMQEAGHRHEPTIAKWFLEQEGHDVHPTDLTNPGEYTIYRSIERPHVYATLDYGAVPCIAHPSIRPVEVKCSWYEAAKVWATRVPIAYQCQGQQQMYVTGAEEMFFAVMLNGYQFRWYRMERHERFIKRLCSKIDEFWDRVQSRNPPPIDGHSSSLRALFNEHPKDDGGYAFLPDELAAEVQEVWDEGQAAAAALARRKDDLKARIQQFMGDAKFAILPDGGGFRWSRNGKTGRFERVENVRIDEHAA